jgi:dsRNA-specific ribonuclease
MDLNKSIQHDEDIVKINNEELLFNPYNSNNTEITLDNIQYILGKYGVPTVVDNPILYQRAFVHRSYVKRPYLENQEQNIKIAEKPNNCLPLRQKSNERLEFLGDGVLECITKYYLYKRFSKENEGFMTEKKIALVKNEAIGKLALEMGLHKWFIISKHAEEKKTRTNLKKLGCLFEAFLGALFLDFNKLNVEDEHDWFKNVFSTGPGFQIAQIFVENIYEKHVDWTNLINNDDNYKNILQVKIQKHFKVTPEYLEISYNSDEGYEMGVYVCLGQSIHETNISSALDYNLYNSFEEIKKQLEDTPKLLIFFASSKHKIKKKAEQDACDKAIKLING